MLKDVENHSCSIVINRTGVKHKCHGRTADARWKAGSGAGRPKSETRRPKSERNPKTEGGKSKFGCLSKSRVAYTAIPIRISAFFRISDFGLLSDFGLRPSGFWLRLSLHIAHCGTDDLVGSGQTRQNLADTIFPQGAHAHFARSIAQNRGGDLFVD
jgi:hypothetical protein